MEEIELVLFRIIQEALSNIRRHSHATEAEVKIQFDEDKIKITVSDNGKGFDLPKNIVDLTRDGKLGLAGMQERARLINANLIMHSQPGNGTEIFVEVPMQSSK